MVNNPRFHDFAERLRNGYLNIYGPPDPLAFPLPAGYYYGPLEGPIESTSGEPRFAASEGWSWLQAEETGSAGHQEVERRQDSQGGNNLAAREGLVTQSAIRLRRCVFG